MHRTPTRLRRALTVPALLALVVAAGACSSDGDQASGGDGRGEPREVTLMLNWTPNAQHAGIYAAEELGYYEDVGIDLEIVEPAATGVEPVVATGEAEFGIAQAESLLPARAAGVPVVSIATLLPHNDSSLMFLADAGIERPRDLEDHTYGGYGGSLETELINRLVECDGGDPSRVEFVEVGNVDYLTGMQRDRFDFAWVFNGWDALRADTVDGVDVETLPFIEYEDCIPDWYTPLLLTSEDTVADDPELVEDFLDATARGYALAISDPQQAADLLLAAAPELDRALGEASTDYHAERFAEEGAPWGVQEAQVWSDFGDFLVDAGLLEEALDTDAAFTDEFLPTDPAPSPASSTTP
ncbi:MAG: ABC transporter substrate-binding protein [Acidimicrobiales bacterium]|nr:ABC transporter substrate-binding protein [Acidimicrobiales bacterium]